VKCILSQRLVLAAIFLIGLQACSSPSYITSNNLLVTQGKSSEAIRRYQERIRENPENGELYYQLAKIRIGQEEYQKATDRIKQSVLLNPLIAKYRFLAGKIYYLSQNYFEAVNYLSSSLSLDKRNLESYYYLALAYQKTGKDKEALAQLNTALLIHPLYFKAHLVWVDIKLEQVLSQSSITPTIQRAKAGSLGTEQGTDQLTFLAAKLQEALKIQPASIQGNLLLSKIYGIMGDQFRARKVLEDWLRKNSYQNQIAQALAELEYSAGNIRAVKKLLEQQQPVSLPVRILLLRIQETKKSQPELIALIQEFPDSIPVRQLQGDRQLELGQLHQAERTYQKILRQAPETAKAYLGLSKARVQLNDLIGAKTAADTALKLEPHSRDAQLHYLSLLLETEDWKNTAQFFENFQKTAQNADFLYYEGILAKQTGQPNKAKELFLQAKILGYSQKVEIQLAELDRSNGEIKKAEETLETLLSLFPDSFEGKLTLGKLRFTQKKFPQVITLLTPYLKGGLGKGAAHLLVAKSYVLNNQLEQALQVLQTGIRIWRRNPDLVEASTLYLGMLKRYDQAITLLEEMGEAPHKFSQLFKSRLISYHFQKGNQKRFQQLLYEQRLNR